VTADYEPALAAKWAISDDKLSFTFWLDERAKWSDGQPVTAEDVRWTFEAIRDPKNLTGEHKVRLETFDHPVIIDAHTIRFTAREVHWLNLGAVGGMSIMPAHVFKDQDFNKINFEFPVVSGPLRISEIKEGIFLRMQRRADWWGWALAGSRNQMNFETITYRFFAETENAFEAFKKGQIDILPVNVSRLWVNETTGEKFEKNWIVKQKIQNHQPSGFQGFAMNMRRPPFDDVRVRKAMAHLLDREKMNSTQMYNQYFLHKSYWEDLYSAGKPCTNESIAFDKEKARKLLKEAGWTANADTGMLEKDGKPFTFRFLTRSATEEKFLAIYGEDLKDVGISMSMDKKDWAAWLKDMDEFNFDMTWASFSGGLFKDPEGMWASKEADRKAGSNYTGFKDPRVDALIEKQKTIFDLQARNEICREIDGILTAQCPFVLLWNINYVRLLYWNKFGTPPTVLSKFGDDSSARSLWWLDEDAEAGLKEAMEKAAHLPAKSPVISFDNEFRK
jgi:microcin C transport system substrate-binding protein